MNDAFQKEEGIFFKKKLIFPNLKIVEFLLQKTSQLKLKRHFKEIVSFDTHSTASSPFVPILKRKTFFHKNPLSKKKQISYVFKKSYYFSRIVRQICYNLVMKNFKFRIVRTFGHFQLASKREKNARYKYGLL